MRHFLTLSDLSDREVTALLDRAMVYLNTVPPQVLRGRAIGLLFEKPSTRTRVSFEVAISRMGGYPLSLSPETTQLGRGETLADTARVLSGYLDGLVIRTFSHETLHTWAQHATVPVINGLTDLHHPCQALADLLTIRKRRGRLAGLKLAYIGAGNNVAHSLMEGGGLMGMQVVVATPQGKMPDAQITARAMQRAQRHGGSIKILHDPMQAAKDADVLYTDVWVSMGEEAEEGPLRALLGAYQINDALVKYARPDVLVMHCLPAHRGEEITASVMDGPHAVIFEQAAHRLPIQQALFESIYGAQP